MADDSSLYEAIGGPDTFVRLVDRFYEEVAADPVLRPMYPSDLGPARERMTAFLAQYFGGPRTYSKTRGHPRLRMRHAPFRMDATTRDRWLRHMRTAVDALELPSAHETQLWDYLERAAFSLSSAGARDARRGRSARPFSTVGPRPSAGAGGTPPQY